MLTIGKMALTTIVPAGGILLGALLGEAADPVMKQPPELPWRDARAPDTTDATSEVAEAVLTDFDPYMGPDSYPPAFASEAPLDWEPDYPRWSYSDFSETIPAVVEEPAAQVIVFETLPLPPEEPTSQQAHGAEPPLPDSPPADGLGPIY